MKTIIYYRDDRDPLIENDVFPSLDTRSRKLLLVDMDDCVVSEDIWLDEIQNVEVEVSDE